MNCYYVEYEKDGKILWCVMRGRSEADVKYTAKVWGHVDNIIRIEYISCY